MNLVDIKVFPLEDNTDRKVQAELRGPSNWSGSYTLKLQVTGRDWQGTNSGFNEIKGDYFLVRVAFDNFKLEDAKKLIERTAKLDRPL